MITKSPAQPHDGGPHPVPLPTPAWVADPHRPKNVPAPDVPVLRSVPGGGHHGR